MGYIAEFNRVNAERTALTGDSGACIQKLHRELFYAWCFLAQEDVLDEALEFLAEHRDIPTPWETASRIESAT